MSVEKTQFYRQFREESQARLTRMHNLLSGAGTDSVPPLAALQEIHREIHALGGTAAVIDLKHVARLAGSIEDVLHDALETGEGISPKQTADIEQGFTLLDDIFRAPDLPMTEQQFAEPVSTLLATLKKKK